MPDSFYKLDVWKLSYDLTMEIYKVTATFPSSEQYGLTNQLRRSANSITANIAESQGRFSYTDRIRVLYIARAEVFETRSHIKVAEGLEFINQKISQQLDIEYERLVKSLNAFIRHLASKRNQSN